ncbi:MAG: hypothetical protein KatS3mg017_0236 [Fimbriimonadales bacterium]|nr:MAG: hypothetical protein KatS3mg017_0236 [Fimbriimonadales bacterium]
MLKRLSVYGTEVIASTLAMTLSMAVKECVGIV